MIKRRDLHECHELFDLMVHPDVFPFVRQKAYSYEELFFLTKQTIEAEDRGELISRTIIDEWGNPIGTINFTTSRKAQGSSGHGSGSRFTGKAIISRQRMPFSRVIF